MAESYLSHEKQIFYLFGLNLNLFQQFQDYKYHHFNLKFDFISLI